jgi:hypothetical protein
VCERCRQGWQEGAGARIAIQPAAVERAMCDAQHIGSIDGAEPERAYQDIPPSVARLVWRRDRGRCRVPGCRSSRGLELHHLVHRADGGTHEASNLALICSACHQSHHDGVLTISGTADDIEVRRPGDANRVTASVVAPDVTSGASVGAHVGAASELYAATLRTQAKAALTGLGWKPAIATAAVAAAAAAQGAGASLERLIFEALRRCPAPKA